MSATRVALGPVLLAFGGCSACDAWVGAESRVKAAVGEMESGFSVATLDGPALTVTRARFRDLSVFEEREGCVATALVDAEGRDGAVRLSYLGVERIRFARASGRWQPVQPALPRLAQLVDALRLRARAFNERDVTIYRDRLVARAYRGADPSMDRAALLGRVAGDFHETGVRGQGSGVSKSNVDLLVTPVVWTVRIDRGSAEALEEFGLGDSPGKRRARFTLVPEDGVWKFTSGLD